MRIKSENSDAMEIIRRVHREIKQLQRDLDELEYLIYEKDERVKIEFFTNDTQRGLFKNHRDNTGRKH